MLLVALDYVQSLALLTNEIGPPGIKLRVVGITLFVFQNKHGKTPSHDAQKGVGYGFGEATEAERKNKQQGKGGKNVFYFHGKTSCLPSLPPGRAVVVSVCDCSYKAAAG